MEKRYFVEIENDNGENSPYGVEGADQYFEDLQDAEKVFEEVYEYYRDRKGVTGVFIFEFIDYVSVDDFKARSKKYRSY